MLHALIEIMVKLRQYHNGRYMILILFIFVAACIYGNDTTRTIAKEYKRKAVQSYQKGEIYKAIEYYESYLNFEPEDIKSTFRLANLYYSTRNYGKAEQYYDSVTTADRKKTKEAWFFMGIVNMNLANYEDAIENFTTYRKVSRGKRSHDQQRRQATTYLKSAEWAMNNPRVNKAIEIKPLGPSVNKPHIEFAPFPLNENELIYGSFISDPDEKSKSIRKIYKAEKVGEEWKSKGEIDAPANHALYQTGNAALSEDGNRLYFTRCMLNWQNKEICEIYLCEKNDGEWQEPYKLPYPVNDETYTTTQPAIGKNLRTGRDIIYFVSDRPESRGGLDIWYTEFNPGEGEYREPRNLSRRINSAGDECCPFYDHSTRTLYFSSTGRLGYGGFDVYKTTGSGNRWTEAENMMKPINTSYDDLYFSILANGSQGFFTSNRPGSLAMDNGSCCDDIFHYKINECTRVNALGYVFNLTNFDVYKMLNHKYQLDLEVPADRARMPNIPVKLFLLDKESEDEIQITQTRTDENGKYKFLLEQDKDYVIVVTNYGFFDKRLRISTHDLQCEDTITLNETGINFLPEITVRFNVYYEHDKHRLTHEARTVIDTTLLPVFDLFPNAVIEIGSHTDNTGTDSYNIRLSQRRSESVVNYLISKGISEERLIARGYGESQPIAANTNPDGTDNPEGRQLNRRSELKIVGEMNTFYLEE